MQRDDIDPEIRTRAVAAARGRQPFDLLLCNGTVVDVGTGELRAGDVGIVGPMIASVHPQGSRGTRLRSWTAPDATWRRD